MATRTWTDEEKYAFDNPQTEEQTVAFIKRHLLTSSQRDWLIKHDLTIADLLNGRVENRLLETEVLNIFADWE